MESMPERERTDTAKPQKETLERLLEHSLAVHFIAKPAPDYGVTYVSTGVTAQLGYEPTQFTEVPGFWINHIHPEDHARVIAQLESTVDKEHCVIEYRFKHAQGHWRSIHCELLLVCDAQGSTPELVGSWLDITERINTEQALQQALQELEEILTQSTEQLGIRDAFLDNLTEGTSLIRVSDGLIVYTNSNFERMLGYEPGEMIGMHGASLIAGTKEQQQDAYNQITELLDQDGSWSAEVQNVRKDGTTFWTTYQSTLLHHPEFGEVWITMGIDVTSRRDAEEKLRLTEFQLNEAQRIASIGSWVGNIQSNEGIYSDEMMRIFGEDPRTFRSTYETFLERVHPKDRRSVADAMERAYVDHTPFEIDYRILLADGTEKFIHARSDIESDEDGHPIRSMGTVEDITDRRALESQLRQAQKMEVVGQLTGGIAHDFNNLLAVILGNLELLEGSVQSDVASLGYTKEALAAGFRGAELTKRLLAFARQQRLEPEVIQIEKLITGLEPLLKRTLGEDITLHSKSDDDLWPTRIDLNQMESSLINLAVNARDAMIGGGTLAIETANTKLDQAIVVNHAEIPPGEYVLLSVSDSGSGIPGDVLHKVFEPFFSTKDVGKGSGLGLSMVYGFVQQSKGYVGISSEEGHGTCVQLYLPRAEPEADGSGLISTRNIDNPTGTETILMAEDETGVREVASRLLTDLGYRVIEAGSGAEALATLAEHDDIDLLLTDIVMPGGMTGVDLASQARARYPNLRVLYTSGHTALAIPYVDAPQSTQPMLHKPYRKEELAQVVRQVLDFR
ncbi:MAG: PAS domain-containing protein [Pseudomonadales bacterium]